MGSPEGIDLSISPVIAVVIPCYRVAAKVLGVIEAIGPEVAQIFVIDDKCPERSGALVERECHDPRVRVLHHEVNKGVGGAIVTGYRAALDAEADIIIKVDGDGQMDPALIPVFVAPLAAGEADYVKGNRFYSISATRKMPAVRIFGNAALSFVTKLSSGYWSIFDPTNGYTAINSKAAISIELEKLAERYFFETDMLIKLGDVRAVVLDVPMRAKYEDEVSSLKLSRVIGDFIWRHLAATTRRLFYSYFLRDFNIASLNLAVGMAFLLFGTAFGVAAWMQSSLSGVPATTGTVMISVLPIVVGIQMLLFFFSFDMGNEPRRTLQSISGAVSLLRQESQISATNLRLRQGDDRNADRKTVTKS